MIPSMPVQDYPMYHCSFSILKHAIYNYTVRCRPHTIIHELTLISSQNSRLSSFIAAFLLFHFSLAFTRFHRHWLYFYEAMFFYQHILLLFFRYLYLLFPVTVLLQSPIIILTFNPLYFTRILTQLDSFPALIF